ncbi:hypothetical protein SAPIO_CDS4857 [Scedosporium apiospermum]|uniref:Mitochondrial zinc maintenance protein 1, mitochondrial n=1 Tax=Pseudallescheria apiosperma TaxID=563466 RepID=A0A084G775_PSEDA|nr:uncharacterized protein SAPIO_CDS4857 [Scedosporium apiospermum]KEZ43187.1 hypothetical protein SAPIO_CDS4857 [Scedosporium apiospermum]
MALAAYRNLFRATQVAFRGDQRLLIEARNRIREEFRAGASPSDPDFQKRIQHAQEVASVLRANVVQGVQEENDVYRLRIHDQTERGDNDSIKSPTQTLGGGKCGCS